MRKTLLAIRHIAFEDLGYFEAALLDAGFDIRYLDAARDGFADIDPVAPSLIVVLGGPMGVYETGRFPFLSDGLRLIEKRIAAGKPLLGICLGAQLIARAMGGDVYHGPIKEIGFAPIRLTAAGERSVLAPLADGAPVLHWHGDSFDLPPGSQLLASTESYANQAFSVGPGVLGLQFHLEAGDRIDQWLTGHAAELRAATVDPASIRADAARHAARLKTVSRCILSQWLVEAGLDERAP